MKPILAAVQISMLLSINSAGIAPLLQNHGIKHNFEVDEVDGVDEMGGAGALTYGSENDNLSES